MTLPSRRLVTRRKTTETTSARPVSWRGLCGRKMLPQSVRKVDGIGPGTGCAPKSWIGCKRCCWNGASALSTTLRPIGDAREPATSTGFRPATRDRAKSNPHSRYPRLSPTRFIRHAGPHGVQNERGTSLRGASTTDKTLRVRRLCSAATD
jgi:hypothetical protein